ncbi:hypothetical protein IT575_13395 [bacterium]|nr:hypothetical protein [bacterium]
MRGNNRITPEELAALLDGEVRDSARAEQLAAMITSDPELKAEYEAQRAVKIALSKVEDTAAPDFMSTRVLGRISIERKVRSGFRLPVLRLAGGAAALFATGITTGVYVANHLAPAARTAAPMFAREDRMPARGVFASTDEQFSSPDSLFMSLQQPDLALPEDQIDPGLADFLQLANDAHSYRKAMLATGHMVSPDMPMALALISESDGTVFADSPASDDYRQHTVMAGDSN